MWREALNAFIERYKDKDEVEAIMLVGSYAVGNNNEYSDIDVYIIINDDAKYRERGNLLVKGYLIEYFINPIYKVKDYMEKDVRGHGGSMANMLINGKVLYDKNNIIKDLRKLALDYNSLCKDNEKNNLLYYGCWCIYDEYKAAKYHNHLQYYLCLVNLIEAYLKNNNYNVPPKDKVEKFFKDKEYRKKYNIGNFPNNKFNKLVINCFDNELEENLDKLYEYVVIKDGKFDINNFKNVEYLE